MRKNSRKCSWILLLCVVLAATTCAQAQKEQLPVRPQQVVDAMRAYGLKASPEQIELLARVKAAAGASLRVTNQSKGVGDATFIRLRCVTLSDCRPFYALAHGIVSTLRAAENLPQRPVQKGQMIVRKGQLVSLLVESANFRITISAVCLDNGRTGDVVRLRSEDRKRVYTGRVVDNKTVRSTA